MANRGRVVGIGGRHLPTWRAPTADLSGSAPITAGRRVYSRGGTQWRTRLVGLGAGEVDDGRGEGEGHPRGPRRLHRHRPLGARPGRLVGRQVAEGADEAPQRQPQP
eukprot:6775519-Pyramimonas_sp.AAC.1